MNPVNQSTSSVAIQQAIKQNDTKQLKHLINKDNVNQTLPNQQLPLHLAVRMGNIPAIKALLKSGANPRYYDSQGLNAIEHACLIQNKQALSTILTSLFGKEIKKENINWKTSDESLTRIKSVIETIANIQFLNKSIIAEYAYQGDVQPFNKELNNLSQDEKVKLIKKIDENGFSIIHYAIAGNQRKIFDICMEILTEEDLSEIKTKNGDTLLHWAAIGNAKSFVEHLAKQIDPNVKNSSKETPLHYALGKRDYWAAKILIQRGGNLFEEQKARIALFKGITPLNLITSQAIQKDPLAISTSKKVKFFISAALTAGLVATPLWKMENIIPQLEDRKFQTLAIAVISTILDFSTCTFSPTQQSFILTLLISQGPTPTCLAKGFVSIKNAVHDLSELKKCWKNFSRRKWDATKKAVVLGGNTLFSLYALYLYGSEHLEFNLAGDINDGSSPEKYEQINKKFEELIDRLKKMNETYIKPLTETLNFSDNEIDHGITPMVIR